MSALYLYGVYLLGATIYFTLSCSDVFLEVDDWRVDFHNPLLCSIVLPFVLLLVWFNAIVQQAAQDAQRTREWWEARKRAKS